MEKDYKKEAIELVKQLKRNCTFETICENYGQKEINRFLDTMHEDKENELSYQEQCEIEDILYKINEITPK
mgnify:CR=1 FL=1